MLVKIRKYFVALLLGQDNGHGKMHFRYTIFTIMSITQDSGV